MKQGIWNQEHLGDPIFDGLTFGGQLLVGDLAGGVFSKSEYPGLRAIRDADGSMVLTRDLTDPYTPAGAGAVDLPGVIGYVEQAASQSGIGATITDLTDLAVTFTAVAGRLTKVTGHVQMGLTFSGTETLAGVGLVREGSTTLGRFGSFIDNGSGSRSQMQEGSVILALSAGSHTVKLSMQRTTGAGTVSSDASSANPSWILVEDLGAASPAEEDDVLELWY